MQPAITSLVEFGLATAGASTLTFSKEMKTCDKLLELVRDFGGDLNPPCNRDDIARAEVRLGFSLPESMREFYSRSNGASIHDNLWEFFGLQSLELHHTYRHQKVDAIKTRCGRKLNPESMMIFADVMIDAPSYWICIDPHQPVFGKIYCDGDEPWWCAAESYDEFIDKLQRDIDDIFMGLDAEQKKPGEQE